MKALLLAFLVAMPPGIHYQGTQGTGATVPPITLARDTGSSFPLTNTTSSTGTVTVSGITSAGAAVFVAVGWDTDDATPTVAWSGGDPANTTGWTKQADATDGGSHGRVSIWTASSTAAVSGAAVVFSSTTGNSGRVVSVDAYSGASLTTIATNTAVGQTTGALAIALTPNGTGSRCIGAFINYAGYGAPSIRSDNTSDYDAAHSSGVRTTQTHLTAACSGASTLGTTAPTSTRWQAAAIEIRSQ